MEYLSLSNDFRPHEDCEDIRGRSEDVSIIHHQIQVFESSMISVRVIDIFTCEDNTLIDCVGGRTGKCLIRGRDVRTKYFSYTARLGLGHFGLGFVFSKSTDVETAGRFILMHTRYVCDFSGISNSSQKRKCSYRTLFSSRCFLAFEPHVDVSVHPDKLGQLFACCWLLIKL